MLDIGLRLERNRIPSRLIKWPHNSWSTAPGLIIPAAARFEPVKGFNIRRQSTPYKRQKSSRFLMNGDQLG